MKGLKSVSVSPASSPSTHSSHKTAPEVEPASTEIKDEIISQDNQNRCNTNSNDDVKQQRVNREIEKNFRGKKLSVFGATM